MTPYFIACVAILPFITICAVWALAMYWRIAVELLTARRERLDDAPAPVEDGFVSDQAITRIARKERIAREAHDDYVRRA